MQILSRFETRSTWVSTAIAGIPNASPNTTFAVFLPTPGRDINSSLVVGTCPSKRSISCCAHALIFFALLRYKPIVFILRMISSIEASANASGVAAACPSASAQAVRPASSSPASAGRSLPVVGIAPTAVAAALSRPSSSSQILITLVGLLRTSMSSGSSFSIGTLSVLRGLMGFSISTYRHSS